jgi:hypothetical protein
VNNHFRPRYTVSDAELQNMMFAELLPDLRPHRDGPTAEYTLSADGTRLTLRGPYQAIWSLTRLSGDARREIEAGTREVELELQMGGRPVFVHYIVTDN